MGRYLLRDGQECPEEVRMGRPGFEQKLDEAMRVVKLREEQMKAAALTRNAGDIDNLEWDAFAVRYADAVREWWAWQHYALQHREGMTQTHSGPTYVVQQH